MIVDATKRARSPILAGVEMPHEAMQNQAGTTFPVRFAAYPLDRTTYWA
jgi:hypothetical protein